MNVSAIVVMLWSLLAAAQAVPGSHIEGTVIDSATLKPLSGVTVMAIAPEGSSSIPATTITSADGRFTLDDIRLSRVVLAGTKPGYPFNNVMLTLTPGNRITNVEIRLTPTGIVVGRVLEPDGRPAVQAQVQIKRFRSLETFIRPDIFTTNDRGEFRAALDEGTYLLAYSSGPTVRPGFEPQKDGVSGPLLYPGVTDSRQAVGVEVKNGEETRIRDVVLTRVRPGAIRIHIINDTGLKPPNVIDFGVIAGSGTGDFNGLFLNIEGGWDREVTREYWPPLPGPYGITAGWRTQDAEGILVRDAKAVEFTGSDVEIELRIARHEGRLRGRVLAEDPNGGPPRPFDNALVSLDSPMNPPVDSVLLAPDGTFRFTHLPLGRYEVSLGNLPGDYYTSSGPREVVISKDETAIELTVAHGAVTVRGTTKGSSATIMLVPIDGRTSSLTRSAFADQNGAFELTYVIPGAYRVYAFPVGMFRGVADAETLKKLESRAKLVTIEKGSQPELTVPLLD